MLKNLFVTIFIIATVTVGYFLTKSKQSVQSTVTPSPQSDSFTEPISGARTRITKKPFGIKISPNNSLVQPEKFSGYHTGVDFETFPEEQSVDVSVYAICDGQLLLKKVATGYGGVVVERCKLNDQVVTVIYGHLRFSSVSVAVGSNLKKGEQLAVLGNGYSQETDGERKHLHLGIHKGSSIVLLGYVQNQGELSSWIDFASYLK